MFKNLINSEFKKFKFGNVVQPRRSAASKWNSTWKSSLPLAFICLVFHSSTPVPKKRAIFAEALSPSIFQLSLSGPQVLTALNGNNLIGWEIRVVHHFHVNLAALALLRTPRPIRSRTCYISATDCTVSNPPAKFKGQTIRAGYANWGRKWHCVSSPAAWTQCSLKL